MILLIQIPISTSYNFDKIENVELNVTKRDTLFSKRMRITYYQLLPGQCMVTGKEDSVYLASGVKISTNNPDRYKYCAASRHLLKRYNTNAPLSFGDTIQIINNIKDVPKKYDFSGKYVIHDATANHIKNTIDILKNVNYNNPYGTYYCKVIKTKIH